MQLVSHMSRQSMAGRWGSSTLMPPTCCRLSGKTQSTSMMHAMQGDLQHYTITLPQSCSITTQVQLAVSLSHLKVICNAEASFVTTERRLWSQTHVCRTCSSTRVCEHAKCSLYQLNFLLGSWQVHKVCMHDTRNYWEWCRLFLRRTNQVWSWHSS